jgi:hypothetical protein
MTTNNGPESNDPRPGGKEQRPHATLDLEASEVSSRHPDGADEVKMRGNEETASERLALEGPPPRKGMSHEPDGGLQGFFTHMAAGVLGALVAFIIAYYAGLTQGGGSSTQGATAEAGLLRAQIVKTEQRLTAMEKALGEANAKVGQLAAGGEEGRALKQQLAAVTERLGRVEGRPAGSALSPETMRETLDPMNAKLTDLEGKLSGVAKAQGDLQTNSKAAALAVSFYNLRRAANEGRPYAAELRSVAAISPVPLDLAALDARREQGIPSFDQLGAEYNAAANAALDAENQPADESMVSELWSKAKSVIRVRRKGDVPGDTTGAILARVEHRLKAGDLAASIQEAVQLKGGAATAFSPWLEKLKARRAADETLARVEATLLTALGGDDQAKRGG